VVALAPKIVLLETAHSTFSIMSGQGWNRCPFLGFQSVLQALAQDRPFCRSLVRGSFVRSKHIGFESFHINALRRSQSSQIASRLHARSSFPSKLQFAKQLSL
jgi:hypothetical protein